MNDPPTRALPLERQLQDLATYMAISSAKIRAQSTQSLMIDLKYRSPAIPIRVFLWGDYRETIESFQGVLRRLQEHRNSIPIDELIAKLGVFYWKRRGGG